MPTKATAADVTTLTFEQIVSADDRQLIEVEIPEWGGLVKVRGLSFTQLNHARQEAWNRVKKDTDETVLNAWCLVHGVVAPGLKFAQASTLLSEHTFGPVNTILAAILAATGLGAKAQAEAKSEPAD